MLAIDTCEVTADVGIYPVSLITQDSVEVALINGPCGYLGKHTKQKE